MRTEQESFTISKDSRAIPGVKKLLVAEHQTRHGMPESISGIWIVDGIPYNTARLSEVTDMLDVHEKDQKDFERLNKKINERAEVPSLSVKQSKEILPREGVSNMSAENGKHIGAAKIGPGPWDLARQQPRLHEGEMSAISPRPELIPIEQRLSQGEALAQMAAERRGTPVQAELPTRQNGQVHEVFKAPVRKVRVW